MLSPVSVTLNFLPADQLAVGDALRRIGLHGDHRVADGELIDRHAEARRSPFRAARGALPRRRAASATIASASRRAARAALIDGDVGAAHDAGGLVEGDVQLVGHHLAERGAGALAEVGLADVERGGVVLVNDDPRIELPEIGIGIRTCALERGAACASASVRPGSAVRAEAHREQSRASEEVPAMQSAEPLRSRWGIRSRGAHAHHLPSGAVQHRPWFWPRA